MKKIVLLTIIIILIFMIGLNPICASDKVNSSNWTNITIDGVNFKLPPEYEGGSFMGEENHTGYMLDTVFDFSLMSLRKKSTLREIYGYESTIDELNSFNETKIGKHVVVLLHSYRYICNHNVTYVFFVVNKTIFGLSFNGDKITDNIQEMIKNTPKSNLSKKKFYERLDEAQETYLEKEEEYDEYYEYTESQRSSKLKTANKHNHAREFANYYIAYRIGQYFMSKKY